MTNLLTKYRDWQSDRKARRLAKWSTQRQKGKSYFVAGYGLFWCVVFTGLNIFVNFAFNDPQNIATIIFQFVWNFLAGLLLGHLAWKARRKSSCQIPSRRFRKRRSLPSNRSRDCLSWLTTENSRLCPTRLLF